MHYILFFLVVFLANIIQGITGFAGTVLAMPFSTMLLGIDVAKPVLNILTMVASILIIYQSYKFVVWTEFFKMTGLMLIGVFVGEWIYKAFPIDMLLFMYGLFIIGIALKGIFIKKEYPLSDKVLLGIIVGAGIIHGMFISGGPLLIIYAVKKLKDKESFRATLAPVWIVLNAYLLFSEVRSGLITPQITLLTLIGVPVLIAAIVIGKQLYNKMSQETFLKVSYLLLLISGISLVL